MRLLLASAGTGDSTTSGASGSSGGMNGALGGVDITTGTTSSAVLESIRAQGILQIANSLDVDLIGSGGYGTW